MTVSSSGARKILFYAPAATLLPSIEGVVTHNPAIDTVLKPAVKLLLNTRKLTVERFKGLVSCFIPQSTKELHPYIQLTIGLDEYNRIINWKREIKPKWLEIELTASTVAGEWESTFVIYTALLATTEDDAIQYFFHKVLNI